MERLQQNAWNKINPSLLHPGFKQTGSIFVESASMVDGGKSKSFQARWNKAVQSVCGMNEKGGKKQKNFDGHLELMEVC